MEDNRFLCPLSKEHYKGCCPIRKCWAHISAKKHASGCLYQRINKFEFGLPELSYLLAKPKKELQDRFENGKEILRQGFELLEQIDEVATETCSGCRYCGKLNKRQCLNQIKCNERQNWFNFFNTQTTFREIFNLDNARFFLLMTNPLNQKRLAFLFNVGKEEQEKIRTLFVK
jgi:hypothetical protein